MARMGITTRRSSRGDLSTLVWHQSRFQRATATLIWSWQKAFRGTSSLKVSSRRRMSLSKQEWNKTQRIGENCEQWFSIALGENTSLRVRTEKVNHRSAPGEASYDKIVGLVTAVPKRC